MQPIRPRFTAPIVNVGAEQSEFYTPIDAILCRHPAYPAPHGTNTHLLAFQPDDAERARLAAGEAIYVSLLTFGEPMTPIIVDVGPENSASWYGLEVAAEVGP